ncbi:MAG: hypothetical protein JO360_07960 [Acidobacteria bacterium]|nr:hypothetical protein [Acidobacteriota bacterium]
MTPYCKPCSRVKSQAGMLTQRRKDAKKSIHVFFASLRLCVKIFLLNFK